MIERESLLKAIFAAPADDLLRLVFADYLDEQDESAWAELIRVQCELARAASGNQPPVPTLIQREQELAAIVWPNEPFSQTDYQRTSDARRGFLPPRPVAVEAGLLEDADEVRRVACTERPDWYQATRLSLTGGLISSPKPLQTILTGSVFEKVTELDFGGREVETPVTENANGIGIFDIELKPVITVRMVEALAQMREARRLTYLDLKNNELDNDAARALASSPHLHRLRFLGFSTGNRFKGRIWQLLIERFGEDVVQ